MKKKKIIKALSKRIEQLEKIVKPDGLTLIAPSDKNKSVFIGIKDGKFTHDVITKTPTTSQSININNQPI
ncbi:hypothetical protein NJT12_24800 [Flavobacterium sp. AC]|uniref:Uncharacterized protein n=1 Tax=Flavobacterium azizsancarii TaxID=2961580 RepID=A0ABT4WLF8_9FLAO|nr:hypothetical protein [Flavobacterium azizsancarii]MDA6072842.1 hypothetical protein [Flavobacterium azizsancarii]